jgi:hypothetical protein
MPGIPVSEIERRLALDNPWWDQGSVPSELVPKRRRALFAGLHRFLTGDIRRSVILYGPRQVGKTKLILQLVKQLLDDGVDRTCILLANVDSPAYGTLSLQALLDLFLRRFKHRRDARLYVFFDEIQYLKDWARHVKVIVDSFPHFRILASGSAAAALRMQSSESGAGRFFDILLPALSFGEFLDLSGNMEMKLDESAETRISGHFPGDTTKMNELFLDYLNFGGFPEIAAATTERKSTLIPLIGTGIVDKVLLKDLPSLYGVDDPQSLQRLFCVLAYRTGQELNVSSLASESGLSPNTIKKYLEYLEAAQLIWRLYRVDQGARTMKRRDNFKVYLTNPSLRAAIWSPLQDDEADVGHVVETAIANHLLGIHQRTESDSWHYARWKDGEVDFVLPHRDGRLRRALEVKWSDRAAARPEEELRGLIHYCHRQDISTANVLTKSVRRHTAIEGISMYFVPAAIFALHESLFDLSDLLRSRADRISAARPLS